MLEQISGRVAWIFNQPNFDIDLIVGVENISVTDIEKLKNVCMKDYDEKFKENVKTGDVIVGGENFGYGHPHYPSFRALRALGIKAVFAESFSPGFYRGETTNGFPLIECPGILEVVDRWDDIEFDWKSNKIKVKKTNQLLKCNVPKKTKKLVKYGGIIEYLKEERV